MGIFVTTSVYALAKQHGFEEADRLFSKQVENPDGSSLAAARSIARLRHLDDVGIRVDMGVGTAAKMRSRMADYAWQSRERCDVWAALDDDCEATLETFRLGLKLVRATKGIVTIPYMLRRADDQSECLSCTMIEPALVTVVAGVHCARTKVGGFGLVLTHRDALEAVRRDGGAAWFTDLDDGGKSRPALFAELQANDRWYGEDWSFFLRVPRSVQVLALLEGVSHHEGRVLPLHRALELPRPKFEED
jgi:hypothetical protein